MDARIEVALLHTGIWAASVADFPQDLSAPDPVLSCGVDWAELGRSCWETNCCILLSKLTVAIDAPPRPHPGHSQLSLCS